MAEQTQPVRRKVALKVIKPGMDTRHVVARFEAERQALALMDHPNIAHILDGGETVSGRPYFVMELVRGVPMTEYCDEKRLSIRERLELFVTICQAVQHAHQKGIIHRDLKPTNVLVTQLDGRPLAKVIDFGVAKATGQKLTDKTLFTGFAQLIGTPLYMSPEQAELSAQDVDTRSDIYSLGVLLYELLSGTTPFDSQRLKSVAFDELRRIIREEEPPRPSTRLTTLALEAASTVGTQRKSDPRQLTRLFRGELDWIVMKCLEKDRTRRYETASALAGDVERYLHDEPVQACPPSVRYRFRKFARRNKATLLTAGAVMIALVLGTVISTWQAIRAYDAEAQTSIKQRAADAFQQLFFNAFTNGDIKRDGRTVTIVEALDRSAKEVQEKFADDPRTKALLLELIGHSYHGLALEHEANQLLDQALELRIGALDRDDANTLNAINNLTIVYRANGRFDEAFRLDEENVKVCEGKLGHEHPITTQAMVCLAEDHRSAGRFDQAIPLYMEVLKLRTAKQGPEHPDTLWTKCTLADAYLRAGRLNEALPMIAEALSLGKAKLGPQHPQTLDAMGIQANAFQDAGRVDEAVQLREEELKLRKAKMGPERRETLASMGNLADAYRAAGRFDEAVRLLEESLKIMTAKLGRDYPDTLAMMGNLANAYQDAGRSDDAVRLYEQALGLEKAKLGPDHHDTLASMADLAADYQRAGRTIAAIRLGEETLKLMKAKFGPEHPNTLTVMSNLAIAYSDAGRSDEAIRLTEEAFKFKKAILGPEHPDTLSSMNNLVSAYVDANRLAEAEPLTREFLEIRERVRPDDWWNFMIRSLLGEVLLGLKKYAEAEPLLISGYEGMQDRAARIPPSFKPRLGDALQRLVQLYEATKQPEKVAAWKAKLAEFEKANPTVPIELTPPTKKPESATESKPASAVTNKSGK
jgi:tetratricopeptide (TPR) repeat protein